MLGTRERTLLLDSLRPPDGYRLRRAIGTSFTLDLMALLTVPVAFTFFDAHDEEGAPVKDPLALLEALRRHAENVTVFCQAGAIGVPGPRQPLLAYLEGSVIEVRPPWDEGIFHPKVWVLAFDGDHGPDMYRVLCLSRNVTFDRAWDTCLRLEGQLTNRRDGYARNEPLADFLLALPRLATRPISSGLQGDLKRMADEVQRVDFQPPWPFNDFRIHPFGLNRYPAWSFPAATRSLVVSPFLAGSAVQKLVRNHGLEVLISRPEAFEDVLRASKALPGKCYVLSPGANLDAREGEKEPSAPSQVVDQVALTGLHAKLFLFEHGRGAHLFTGSANATVAAFESNVEVLFELVGGKKRCGISALLGPDDDPKLETLRSLLQEYTPPECLGGNDQSKGDLERNIDRLARSLGATHLTARARHTDAEQHWDLTLSGEVPDLSAAAVRVWPVTLRREDAQPVAIPASAQPEPEGQADRIATFKGLSFEALTGFFAFEVSMSEGEHTARRQFTLTVDLVGAPENRKERLLRSFLKDRHRVLRLLFLILMDEGADISRFLDDNEGSENGESQSLGGWGQAALLEAILRTLSRNPKRLDQVARVIDGLRSTSEGRDELLPAKLNEIWDPIWEAREALRR